MGIYRWVIGMFFENKKSPKREIFYVTYKFIISVRFRQRFCPISF